MGSRVPPYSLSLSEKPLCWLLILNAVSQMSRGSWVPCRCVILLLFSASCSAVRLDSGGCEIRVTHTQSIFCQIRQTSILIQK